MHLTGYVSVFYQPPDGVTGIAVPQTAIRVPLDFYKEAIESAPYVEKLSEESARKSFVFLTAASNGFLDNTLVAVHSIQKWYPGKPVVFYDIGLSKEERLEVGV